MAQSDEHMIFACFHPSGGLKFRRIFNACAIEKIPFGTPLAPHVQGVPIWDPLAPHDGWVPNPQSLYDLTIWDPLGPHATRLAFKILKGERGGAMGAIRARSGVGLGSRENIVPGPWT